MTKRKAAPVSSAKRPKPAPRNRTSRTWSPFMFLDPQGSFPGWRYGVLRREYAQIRNDLGEFVRRKLHPVNAPPPGQKWAPTAARAEILLPPGGVPDHLLDPQALVELYQAQLLDWQTGLLCVITLKSEHRTLNERWEAARQFAVRSFCRDRGLPVILALHVPSLAGVEGAMPHVHLMAPTRRLLPGLGVFGALDREVSSDAGQLPLYQEYRSLGA
jgi:hypothetical protein